MIGFLVLGFLAAVTAEPPVFRHPLFPFNRISPLSGVPVVTPLPKDVPVIAPRPIVSHPSLISPSVPFGYVPRVPEYELPINHYIRRDPVLEPFGVPVIRRVPEIENYPTPLIRTSPYYSDLYYDRLPFVHSPIVSGIHAPAPIVGNVDAAVPLVSHVPTLQHTFVPPSTLTAPLPLFVEKDEKKEEVKERKEEIAEIEPELTDIRGDEKYSHGYEDEHGTVVKEEGALVDSVLVKKGRYSYKSPEGVPVEINYIADKNGFRVL